MWDHAYEIVIAAILLGFAYVSLLQALDARALREEVNGLKVELAGMAQVVAALAGLREAPNEEQ